jgi:hypothetical protein
VVRERLDLSGLMLKFAMQFAISCG